MGYLGTKPSNSPLTSELIPNSIITNAKINDVAATKLTGQVPDANAPSGSVIQVVSVTKTDVFSAVVAAGSFSDVSGLAASISPISASSKILVMCIISYGTNGSTTPAMSFRVLRGSTPIGIGDAGGGRRQGAVVSMTNTFDNNRGVVGNLNFLDSPSTTALTTYKAQIGVIEPAAYGSPTIFVNSSGGDADQNYITRAVSTITLMEIAA